MSSRNFMIDVSGQLITIIANEVDQKTVIISNSSRGSNPHFWFV